MYARIPQGLHGMSHSDMARVDMEERGRGGNRYINTIRRIGTILQATE
ncbi:hypothetical protein KIPB_014548, partial [Kipferlia bialata]|eukprot:g14548.t1